MKNESLKKIISNVRAGRRPGERNIAAALQDGVAPIELYLAIVHTTIVVDVENIIEDETNGVTYESKMSLNKLTRSIKKQFKNVIDNMASHER